MDINSAIYHSGIEINNLKFFNGATVDILIDNEGEWDDNNITECVILNSFIEISRKERDITLVFSLQAVNESVLSDNRISEIYDGLSCSECKSISFPDYSPKIKIQ